MCNSIGLIGFGIWGSKVLEELIFLRCKVHILEVELTKKEMALDKGALSFVVDINIFLKNDFQGIIIASSTSSHVNLLSKLQNISCPLFVEKPLTNSSHELDQILQLSKPDIFMMHIWKYHPGVNLLAKLAKDGSMGDIKGVKSMRTNWTSPRKDTDSLWNLAIHDLSICETILGQIPVRKQVVAEKHNGTVRGVVALLGEEPYYHFEVSNRYPDKQREIRVFGTKAVAILKDEKVDYVEIHYGDDESNIGESSGQKHYFESTPPLRIEILSFLNYLNGGEAPPTNLEEGIRLIKHLLDIQNKFQ